MKAKRSRRVLVSLPNPMPEVELPPVLAQLLQELIAAGNKGLTSLELQEKQFCSPTNKIHELRDAGADIETVKEPVLDSLGNKHKNVARYIYRGWRQV